MHFDIDSHAMPYVSLLESHLFDPVWAILVLGTVFCDILENCPYSTTTVRCVST